MKPIALTGHPVAQDAVGLQLAAITTKRGLDLKLFLGVSTAEEAHHVHVDGGEVWHCGPYAQIAHLVGHVDRVLPGRDFGEVGPQVVTALNDMLGKSRIGAEITP